MSSVERASMYRLLDRSNNFQGTIAAASSRLSCISPALGKSTLQLQLAVPPIRCLEYSANNIPVLPVADIMEMTFNQRQSLHRSVKRRRIEEIYMFQCGMRGIPEEIEKLPDSSQALESAKAAAHHAQQSAGVIYATEPPINAAVMETL